MGKLNHHPFITHFSHPHPLELTNLDLPNNQSTHYPPQSSSLSTCSACCLPLSSTGYIYTCKSCPNFSLHLPCSQMPSSITHPSHPYHPLSLSPVSTYPGGKFSCDACKLHSGGFSYHCSACSFDLHIKCAVKPLILNHHLHPHPLDLTFAPPYGEGTGFSCDVCRHVGTSHWLYRCGSCEFDVHLDCPFTPGRPAQGQGQGRPAQGQGPGQSPLIHQHSLPVQPLKHQQSMPNQLNHQQSMPAMGGVRPQMQYNNNNYYSQNQRPQAQSWQTQALAGQQSGQMYNARPQPPAPAAANQSMGNMIMQAAVQGFVEGAAQQAGQTLVQEAMNQDNNNNNVDGGGGGDGGGEVDSGNY